MVKSNSLDVLVWEEIFFDVIWVSRMYDRILPKVQGLIFQPSLFSKESVVGISVK